MFVVTAGERSVGFRFSLQRTLRTAVTLLWKDFICRCADELFQVSCCSSCSGLEVYEGFLMRALAGLGLLQLF